MSRMYADLAQVRIYLEGVLFPYAKSVSITEGVSAVNAQIEVPPSIKLRPEELVGMTCHIFYANRRVLDKGWGDPPTHGPPIGKGWPILFQGELVGDSSTRTIESENMSLTFLSHARHFEQVHLMFWDANRSGVASDLQKQALFLGSTRIELQASGNTMDKRSQIWSIMMQRLEDMSSDQERNIAFGAATLNILRNAADNNPIFDHFDRKFRLTNRLAAYVDPDVGSMMKLEKMSDLIDQKSHALPDHTSLMQLLDLPTQIMKYNWNQMAQPSLRKGNVGEILSRGTDNIDKLRLSIRDGVLSFGAILKKNSGTSTRVRVSIPNVGSVSLPADYLTSVESGGRGKVLPTREFEDLVYRTYSALMGRIDAEEELGVTQDENANYLLESFQSVINSYNIPKYTQDTEGERQEPTTSASDKVSDQDRRNLSSPDQKDEVQREHEMLAIDQDTLSSRDELNEFLITPTMEFSQPPRCNVIMPSQMSAFGMSRSYLQEPTRLYGRVPVVPSSQQNDVAIEAYIAPFAQSFHKLENGSLAKFSEAYKNWIKKQENQLNEGE